MSCRAFLGGLLVGAAIGFSGLWRSATSGATVAPRRFTTSDGRRPQPLTARMVEFDETGGVPDGTPTTASVVPTTPALGALPGPGGSSSSSAAPGGGKERGTHWSVGKLHALPSVVDIAAPGMAAHVAQRRSYNREMIMFTSDNQMGGWAYHWVNQMRKWGYEHWLILGDEEATCHTLSNGWKPMVDKYHEEPLSCVYSSCAHPPSLPPLVRV